MQTAEETPEPSLSNVERQSIFDEQSRRRTQAKVWALLIGIVGCSMVWCFGFIVTTALVFYTTFLSRLLPERLTEMYAFLMNYAGGIVGVSVAAVLFTAGLWWFARRIPYLDTPAGLIWRLGARPPDAADPKDQQLVEMITEMGIAASTAIPAARLYDESNINAAIIGDRPGKAEILVSRKMLTTLDRDESQGVIAHLLASDVQGDLRLTGALLRVFHMMGIALMLLDLPFSPGVRKAIALLWRYARKSDQEPATAIQDDLRAALTRSLHPDGLESLTIFVRKLIGEETDIRSILSTILLLPLLPFIVLRLAAGIIYGLTSLVILSPLVAILLRARRLLADATAVRMTQNPDGLARALIRLYGLPHVTPQAGWSEMNFVIGHDSANARPFDRFRARVAEAVTTANNFNHRLRDSTEADAILVVTAQSKSAPASHNFVFGFHPPLGTRIIQLKKLGAKVAWSEGADYSSWIIAAVAALAVGGVLLLALP